MNDILAIHRNYELTSDFMLQERKKLQENKLVVPVNKRNSGPLSNAHAC